MPHTVIQWGAGFTGRYPLEEVLKNRALQLVGLKVFTDGKDGRDAGELVGLQPAGILATRDRDVILSTDADVVLFMPRDPFGDPSLGGPQAEAWLNDLLDILASGKNIVSSLAPPTHWVHLVKGAAFRQKIDDACDAGHSTAFFAGLDPGYFTDALAVSMAAAVSQITAIRSREIVDYGGYTEPDVIYSLGLGVHPDKYSTAALEAIKPGWGGSVQLMAQALGVEVERLEIEPEVYVSPRTFTSSGGTLVEAGAIGAVRWRLSGIVGGQPKISVNHVNRMAPDMAPEWPSVGAVGGYRIEIDGYPPLVGDFPLGLPGGTNSVLDDAMVMTAARMVNAIQTVIEASPGYKTFLDLPPLTGQNALAAPHASAASGA
jgi:4-hydroxy-tetrahydrodipicolinate reductase